MALSRPSASLRNKRGAGLFGQTPVPTIIEMAARGGASGSGKLDILPDRKLSRSSG